MHGPSSDEAFKTLTVWPQVDAHHPLADRILSPRDGSSKDFRRWGFNIFGLETHELGMLAATVLAETGLPCIFGISMKVLVVARVCVEVSRGERDGRLIVLFDCFDCFGEAGVWRGQESGWWGCSGRKKRVQRLPVVLDEC